MPLLKVLHISTSDISGGAAKATYKLHHELLRQGVFSRMLVRYKLSDDETVISFVPKKGLVHGFVRRIKRYRLANIIRKFKFRKEDYDVFSSDRSEFSMNLDKYIIDYDIINLHWINGFIDLHAFLSRYGQSKKIVWRLADMNPFTGGCHYSWTCERFLNICGNCPQSHSPHARDLSAKILYRKRKIFEKVPTSNLTVVAISKWIYNYISGNSVFREFDRSLIQNGIEPDKFNRKNKLDCRRSLGIPEDRNILFLIADDLSLKMKGSGIAFDAINGLSEDYFIIVAGKSIGPHRLRVPYHHFGYVNDKKILALLYAAADAFLFTSLQENLPNTALESMACGTPVIGFSTGGIVDIAIEGEHAFYTKEASAEALRETLIYAFADKKKLALMSENCAIKADKEFRIADQAAAYITLYTTMIKQ